MAAERPAKATPDMGQSVSGDDQSGTRPWIVSFAYWNEVARDVVKSSAVAFVIYLGGVVSGVFRLHPEILVIVGAFGVVVLMYGFGYPIIEQRFPRLTFGHYLILMAVVLAFVAGGVFSIVSLSRAWKLVAAAVFGGVAAYLGAYIHVRRRLGRVRRQLDEIAELQAAGKITPAQAGQLGESLRKEIERLQGRLG